jgi:diguanylate cyclase (GGDEF)-like protein
MTKARKREEAAEQAVALLGEVAAGYYGGDPSADQSRLALPPAPPAYIPEPIEHPNLGYTPIELPGGAMLPTGEGYDTTEDEGEAEGEGNNRRFRRGSRRRRRRARQQAEAAAAQDAWRLPTIDEVYAAAYADNYRHRDHHEQDDDAEYEGERYEAPSPYDGIAEAIQEVTEDARLTDPDGVAPIAFEWSADLDRFVEDPPARDVVEEAPFPVASASVAPLYETPTTTTADDLAALANATLADEADTDERITGVRTADQRATDQRPNVETIERRQGTAPPRPVVAPKSERVERLSRGLDLVFEYDSLWSMAGRAINQIAPAANAQLLTSNESGELGQALTTGPDPFHHGCAVPDREMCPAMRLERTMRFESSAYLDACPFLAIREDGPLSAACVPFRSQRSLVGVLHTTAPVDAPTSDEQLDELTVALALVGKRSNEIGGGSSEGTGTEILESTIDQLVEQGTPFAIALVHLDNFRLYNRAHGLDIGDAAVQRFDQVARRVVRPEDVVSGDGGDEFFMVFPHTTAKGAAVVCDRIRSELAASFIDNGVPRFTVSIGVADTDDGATFDQLLAVIERAVVHAEAAGHDLVVSTKVLAARQDDSAADLASR